MTKVIAAGISLMTNLRFIKDQEGDLTKQKDTWGLIVVEVYKYILYAETGILGLNILQAYVEKKLTAAKEST